MEFRNDKRAALHAWIWWALLVLATAGIILAGGTRSVVPAYRTAALDWIAGRNMYDGTGIGGFVYFPQAAILFAPFAILPPVIGEALWRLVNIGVFALSLRVFAGIAARRSGKDFFPLMTLVAIPLAWDCARNGQATLLMTAFMLLAVADTAGSRWWRAALWLALAVAVKPLAIVLVLLIMAVDRPMIWRVPAAMAALALFPFATQHPAYVLQQYSVCFENMTMAAHVGVVAHGWTSPFTALRVAGIEVPERVQTLLRISAAAATLALCALSRRRHGAAWSAVFMFSLAVLYLMLFSPRTENNTYAMLGPAIGVFFAGAFLDRKRSGERLLLTGLVFALAFGRPIQSLMAPNADQIWLSPLIATCFSVYLLIRFFTGDQTETAPAAVHCPVRR